MKRDDRDIAEIFSTIEEREQAFICVQSSSIQLIAKYISESKTISVLTIGVDEINEDSKTIILKLLDNKNIIECSLIERSLYEDTENLKIFREEIENKIEENLANLYDIVGKITSTFPDGKFNKEEMNKLPYGILEKMKEIKTPLLNSLYIHYRSKSIYINPHHLCSPIENNLSNTNRLLEKITKIFPDGKFDEKETNKLPCGMLEHMRELKDVLKTHLREYYQSNNIELLQSDIENLYDAIESNLSKKGLDMVTHKTDNIIGLLSNIHPQITIGSTIAPTPKPDIEKIEQEIKERKKERKKEQYRMG